MGPGRAPAPRPAGGAAPMHRVGDIACARLFRVSSVKKMAGARGFAGGAANSLVQYVYGVTEHGCDTLCGETKATCGGRKGHERIRFLSRVSHLTRGVRGARPLHLTRTVSQKCGLPDGATLNLCRQKRGLHHQSVELAVVQRLDGPAVAHRQSDLRARGSVANPSRYEGVEPTWPPKPHPRTR